MLNGYRQKYPGPRRPTLLYTNAGPRLKRKFASELANEKDHYTNLLCMLQQFPLRDNVIRTWPWSLKKR